MKHGQEGFVPLRPISSINAPISRLEIKIDIPSARCEKRQNAPNLAQKCLFLPFLDDFCIAISFIFVYLQKIQTKKIPE